MCKVSWFGIWFRNKSRYEFLPIPKERCKFIQVKLPEMAHLECMELIGELVLMDENIKSTYVHMPEVEYPFSENQQAQDPARVRRRESRQIGLDPVDDE